MKNVKVKKKKRRLNLSNALYVKAKRKKNGLLEPDPIMFFKDFFFKSMKPDVFVSFIALCRQLRKKTLFEHMATVVQMVKRVLKYYYFFIYLLL